MAKDLVEITLLKSTWRYESGDGAPVRTLYLNKGALSPMPDAIRLVVEAVRPSEETS